ncbi:MAG: PD40 domain-containing protein [Anaerolineales bacterium]|nr:PD40 domain-containing protein [Anaerolineales bacterium]
MNKTIWTMTLLICVAGCSLPAASTPTADLFATLQASTPSDVAPFGATEPAEAYDEYAATSPPTEAPQEYDSSPSSADQLTGQIVFTCQVNRVQATNQICIINADGSGFRQLTSDNVGHFYPSLSPDGQSVLYSAFREQNVYEIYEMNLSNGETKRLTNRLGIANAPEVSPDGESIVFMRGNPNTQENQIWVMQRNGEYPENIPQALGWDPTWSPNGKFILFASDRDGEVQLFTVSLKGGAITRVSDLPSMRGRSDWSPDGSFIVTYAGEPWYRELYIMDADGSNARQITPSGGNSQGPSISPDGQWVAFTAYFDHYGDDHGCEIYLIRIDGTDLRRLTDNNYCDYQPRWGP